MAAGNQIVVSGAREHNLKDISVTLPREALVVIKSPRSSAQIARIRRQPPAPGVTR